MVATTSWYRQFPQMHYPFLDLKRVTSGQFTGWLHVQNGMLVKLKFDLLQVVCDTYTPQGEPIPTNKRHRAAKIFSDPKVASQVPW